MISGLNWKPVYYDREFTTHVYPYSREEYEAGTGQESPSGIYYEDLVYLAAQISRRGLDLRLNPVGAVTDFAPFNTSYSFTPPDSYTKLTSIEFVYGLAHEGYHNYILSNDKVYETPGGPNITSGFAGWVKSGLYADAQGWLILPPDQNVPKEMVDNLKRLRGVKIPPGKKTP